MHVQAIPTAASCVGPFVCFCFFFRDQQLYAYRPHIASHGVHFPVPVPPCSLTLDKTFLLLHGQLTQVGPASWNLIPLPMVAYQCQTKSQADH
ncbi:hypothetical protein Micbo1qcDRAFT_157373, partial [Microdochium bolleyi]